MNAMTVPHLSLRIRLMAGGVDARIGAVTIATTNELFDAGDLDGAAAGLSVEGISQSPPSLVCCSL